MRSTVPFQLEWGPGLIGLTVAIAFYGVGVCQFAFYLWAFPHDMVQLKSLVSIVFILETVQTSGLILAFHHLLIHCRLNDSPECTTYLSASLLVVICLSFCITFTVQCFYAHRVWIISGRNRVITSVVFLFAAAQLVLGLLFTAGMIHTPTFQLLATLKFSPLAAVTSAVCDALIMGSVMYYLRPARTGVNRRDNYIKRLNIIFVQMGLLSFINALAVAIMYYIQDHGTSQFLTGGPGFILSKTYVNSMLSVLNARKSIREERKARAERAIEIPTIPTIY
ncbi:hypothetical protein EV363DRAFT_1450687 [Boletus edulis]|nr:hypothetical protein EV363DRAFT_1450687 [Boletus edulis]